LTPFETRRTSPLFFSKTNILLSSRKAMLVGEDNPSTTNSALKLESLKSNMNGGLPDTTII
jgi:hypothetical protein